MASQTKFLSLALICAVGLAGIAAGLGVSLGFIGYHANSLHTPFTNPYIGRDGIGPVQLAPVFACIALGAWLAYAAWPARRTSPANGAATA